MKAGLPDRISFQNLTFEKGRLNQPPLILFPEAASVSCFLPDSAPVARRTCGGGSIRATACVAEPPPFFCARLFPLSSRANPTQHAAP